MKAFVIYKEGDEFSTQLAEECIESARQFGVDVEKFPGVYNNITELIKTEQLFPNPDAVDKVSKIGVQGCLLSHLALWKLAVELNEPVFVFEHDSLMINPLPTNVLEKFEDYLNLDYNRKIYRKDLNEYEQATSNRVNMVRILKMKVTNGSGFKYINRNHITGAHGYIIKPEGAAKIIKGIKEDGMLPADIAPNSKYVNMYQTSQTIVKVNIKMTTNMTKLSHTRN